MKLAEAARVSYQDRDFVLIFFDELRRMRAVEVKFEFMKFAAVFILFIKKLYHVVVKFIVADDVNFVFFVREFAH